MRNVPQLNKAAYVLLSATLVLSSCAGGAARDSGPANDIDQDIDKVIDEDAARAAFEQVARVLRHPRCLNCHTNTEFPRVGDNGEPHAMNVLRGPENKGMPGLRCSNCHQPENQDLAGVPGAPHWHLAPLSMGWEQLDDHSLAESLKDTSKNGGRSLEDLLKHMSDDPLVLWAWDPGVGRAVPPTSHDAFVAAVTTWIENGAVSPPPGNVSSF